MRVVRALQLAVAVAVAVVAIGCSDPNYRIGDGLFSSDNDMETGVLDFAGVIDEDSGSRVAGQSIFSARVYKNELINAANQSVGVIGAQYDTDFGERTTGFYVQYTPQYGLDEEGFGYNAILDSVMIYISLNSYGGDTTRMVKYDVYEVVDGPFIPDTDVDEDADIDWQITSEQMEAELAADGVLSDVLFSFKYPDPDNDVYLATTSMVRVYDISEAGYDLLDRLMLKKGDATYETYEDYDDDCTTDEFVSLFKGLYICASEDQEIPLSSTENDGSTYGFTMSSSGWGFYGRSVYENAPTIIKDTVGMTYLFRDSYASAGGISAQVTNYGENFTSYNTPDTRGAESVETLFVEGLGGFITEITIEQALMQRIAEIVDATDEYNNLFFNVAAMSIYVPSATGYGDYVLDSPATYNPLNDVPSRLCLYTNYTTFIDEDDITEMETIADYDYAYEYYYSTNSSIDGTLSRSRGCYTLNIPYQLQSVWNNYLTELEANGGVDFTEDEWDSFDWNKMLLAMPADNLNNPKLAKLQGPAGGSNAAPMRLQITYTLLKK
ncbi:MAG: DUF4270 family protein [Rikenellaceae bacterium]